jgi:hypothetical protein
MWDTHAECICDMVQWFPTKVTMPWACSNDLILVGLQDIQNVLTMANTNSPLATNTYSHAALLH